MDTKLIVLRGNSGSGKSTVAKKLREVSQGDIALIEQDYLRRTILQEVGDKPKVNNADLIFQTVTFALERNYHVILEGVFTFHPYKEMFRHLVEKYPNTFFYYFDISLEETLRRHRTKPNADEFSEEKIREWYLPKDHTGFPNEAIIGEDSSQEETVQRIKLETGL